MRSIEAGEDLIDVRDVIERVEELETERETLVSNLSDAVDDLRTAEEAAEEAEAEYQAQEADESRAEVADHYLYPSVKADFIVLAKQVAFFFVRDEANAQMSSALSARDAAESALEDWDDENSEELKIFTALLEDLKGGGGDEEWRGDWYPSSLINDSYFETVMDELLEDIGLPKDIPSYLTIVVDYDALREDYSSVEYDGFTYWYR